MPGATQARSTAGASRSERCRQARQGAPANAGALFMVLHPTPAASVPARYFDIVNPGGGRCGAPGSWVLFPSCRGCSARLAPARRMSIRTQRYRRVRSLDFMCKLPPPRSEEHTSELQSLMRISYAVFCLKKKKKNKHTITK